ncbi:MAG: hypothetical protein Q9227_009226 [Pyrenula ochraceoflavens]
MDVFSIFSIIVLVSLAACQPYTYWIDRSCQERFGDKIQTALNDGLNWAALAANRLNTRDRIQMEYFQRLFSPSGRPGQPQYEEQFRKVQQTMGHVNFASGIADIVPVRSGRQTDSNYRIYCDNDHRGRTGGSTRWQLQPDPSQVPADYVPQARRPLTENAQSGEPWQEYLDPFNGVFMGGTPGCNDRAIAASGYVVTADSPIYSQKMRATLTVISVRNARCMANA